jgi:hypothetical protein
MNSEDRLQLLSNIRAVLDKKTGKEIPIETIDFVKCSAPSSSTKVPIHKIQLNGEILSRHNPYRICYACIVCGSENTVNLDNVARKVNRNRRYCQHCRNLIPEKQQQHAEFMTGLNIREYSKPLRPRKKTLAGQELLDVSWRDFAEMDSDFIEAYYRKNLTTEEFNRIQDKIVHIQHGKIRDLGAYDYIPHVRVWNQVMFVPKLFHRHTKLFEDIQDITYRCESCHKQFTNRDLSVQKNKLKIYCQDCNFCNRTFRIRSIKNACGEHLTYQSPYELKFVRFCNESGIRVLDGPTITYSWNGKEDLRYRVDFYLPDLNWIVELKDNHHFHRHQVECGKWTAKMNAVEQVLHHHTYDKFLLIFPKNYAESLKLIRKHLDKI